MRMKMRPRYYCDYCKKCSGRKDVIERHEGRCTLNPNRVCGCCLLAAMKQPTMEQLFEACRKDLQEFGDPASRYEEDDMVVISKAPHLLEATSSHVHDTYCPACQLAAIRQFKGGSYAYGFVFKDSLETWMCEFGNSDARTAHYC